MFWIWVSSWLCGSADYVMFWIWVSCSVLFILQPRALFPCKKKSDL